MNEKLHKDFDTVANLISIQGECLKAGSEDMPYMYGMMNGMIIVHSIFADIEPKFVSMQRRKRKNSNIRHKAVSKRKTNL